MTYKLHFKSSLENTQAVTEIDADADVDAIEEAMRIVQRRQRERIEGTHELELPDGERVELERYMQM